MANLKFQNSYSKTQPLHYFVDKPYYGETNYLRISRTLLEEFEENITYALLCYLLSTDSSAAWVN